VLALVGSRLFREEILEPVLAVTGAKDFGAALALVGPAVSSLS
jgi:acyl-CoA reductase-like NAD-dependent aldehyde dehydrogenase